MSAFTMKNEARRENRPAAGSRDRKLYNGARARRRLLDGKFGNLRTEKTMDQYLELCQGTKLA